MSPESPDQKHRRGRAETSDLICKQMDLKINAINNNPDVVFDKDMIFSAFCSKCCFFMKITYIQVLIKNNAWS